MPPAGEHLWTWFIDMARCRQVGHAGYQALPEAEMQAWHSRTGHIVRPEEWAILRDMDQAFLNQANAKPGEGQAVRSGSSELEASAFDAVFG